MIKPDLEKYFEAGVVDVNKQDLPVIEAEEPEQQETPPEVEVDEIGDAPETVLETTEEPQGENGPEEIESPLEVISEEPETVTEDYKVKGLPEGVEKLVEFMNETGGSVEEYLTLNKDYTDVDDTSLLKDYYNKTKSHLDNDDINFMINKKFNVEDEDMAEDEVRERKIALKEELSNAKQYLNSQKDKYYKELRSGGTARQEALNKAGQEAQESAVQQFQEKTNETFKGFEGFVFDLGEKRKPVRYRVNDVEKLKSNQENLDKVFGKYFEDGKLVDGKGFHKAAFAASNADNIASLFYEQGYAKAVEELQKTSKNVDFEATKKAPTSDSKLRPGQAKEISPYGAPTHAGKINLKYGKL